jgi:hypothetical protein
MSPLGATSFDGGAGANIHAVQALETTLISGWRAGYGRRSGRSNVEEA